MIPDAVAQQNKVQDVEQISIPVPQFNRVTIAKGDNLGKHIKQTLLEQGKEPNKDNVKHLIDQTKVTNPGLTNENLVFPNQALDIPLGSISVNTPAKITERKEVDADVLAHWAAEVQKALPSSPYTWLTSICAHGLFRYNQAFSEPADGLSPQELSTLVGRYWDNNPASRGYAVSLDHIGNPATERYIDDGNWNALQRVLQYAEQKKRGEATDDAALTEAQAMLDINMAHYDPAVGLVRWKKQPDPAKVDVFTAIATATGAELALLLNQFTTDPVQHQKNLDFATQAYEGTRRILQDPVTKLYYDGLSGDGKGVDKRLYSYNTGVMISAGMWLYSATGEKEYLEQAEQAAFGAL